LKIENCKFEAEIVLAILLVAGTAFAGTATITIDADKAGARLNP